VSASGGENEREVDVRRLPVALGVFLKLAGAVRSCGEAKERILSGGVRVNGQEERRRGRSLVDGDRVWIAGMRLRVTDAGLDGPTGQ
jgi:ribosome-associated protein